jgi:hypothetical protein
VSNTSDFSKKVWDVGNERKDVDVALAFGCEAVLFDRAGAAPVWGQRRTIRSLQELLANL